MSEIRNGNNHHLGTVLLFLTGAAAGATAALLLAPKSGRETRDAIRTLTRETGEKATKIPAALRAAYERASDAARQAFTDVLRDA